MCIRVFADGRWRRPQHPGRTAVGAGTGHVGRRPLRLPEPSGLLLPQYHFRPVTTKIFTLRACRKFLSADSSVTAQYPMSYRGPDCRDLAVEHHFRCGTSVAKFSMHVDNLILCVCGLSCLVCIFPVLRRSHWRGTQIHIINIIVIINIIIVVVVVVTVITSIVGLLLHRQADQQIYSDLITMIYVVMVYMFTVRDVIAFLFLF